MEDLVLESVTHRGHTAGKRRGSHDGNTGQRGPGARRAAALLGATLLVPGGLTGLAAGTAHAAGTCQPAPTGAALTTSTSGGTTTCTYTYTVTGNTGGEFQFPVPSGVSTLTAGATGGRGGTGGPGFGSVPGSFGASVTNAHLTVPVGTTTLYVEVAGNGTPGAATAVTNPGGFNGGGSGDAAGAGGGGGSAVQTCSTSSSACTGSYTGNTSGSDPRLLVAARGGGSSAGQGGTGAGPRGAGANIGCGGGGAGGGVGHGGGGGGGPPGAGYPRAARS
ncbi:hypothetical protein ACFW7O_45845, partial [Streptomyces diastatochromogenes]